MRFARLSGVPPDRKGRQQPHAEATCIRPVWHRSVAQPLFCDCAGPPVIDTPADTPGQSARARLAIADKNPVVRAGLADIVTRDGRFQLTEVVSSAHAFIELCGERPIDIGVIGWSLTDMSGGDVLALLKRRQIKTRVIIYTGESGQDVLRQAVKAGAWGFISKADDPSILLDTISTVSRGRLCLPYVDLQTINDDPLETLTTRERELLSALANGWSNLQIASRIGISRNTVKYHLKNLYDKLGVNNRAMAVALFMSGTREHR
jgi:two-component system nitrate/nitrite response regulator NarP